MGKSIVSCFSIIYFNIVQEDLRQDKFMGLLQIFMFSVFAGVSFGIALQTGDLLIRTDFLSEFASRISEPTMQALLGMFSIIFSFYFIFRLAKILREIYEYRLAGIVITLSGFFGLFLATSGTLGNSSTMFVSGVAILCIGIFVVFYMKKDRFKKIS